MKPREKSNIEKINQPQGIAKNMTVEFTAAKVEMEPMVESGNIDKDDDIVRKRPKS